MAKNKIAIVTGGSRGLGRDMVLNLVENDVDVIFTYHSNLEKANEVEKETGGKAKALQLDTRNISSFDSFYSET